MLLGSKVRRAAFECFLVDEVPPGAAPWYDTSEQDLSLARYFDESLEPVWKFGDHTGKFKMPLVEIPAHKLERACRVLLVKQSESQPPVDLDAVWNHFGQFDLGQPQFLELSPLHVLAMPEPQFCGVIARQGDKCNILLWSPHVVRIPMTTPVFSPQNLGKLDLMK